MNEIGLGEWVDEQETGWIQGQLVNGNTATFLVPTVILLLGHDESLDPLNAPPSTIMVTCTEHSAFTSSPLDAFS